MNQCFLAMLIMMTTSPAMHKNRVAQRQQLKGLNCNNRP